MSELSECKKAGSISKDTQQTCDELRALRERAEKAERMLAFYKSALDALPNPIFVKDDRLRFVFFNKAYKAFFGIEDDGHIGQCVLDLDYLTEEEKERYQAEDSRVLESLSAIQHEMQFQTGEGSMAEALYWSRGFTVQDNGSRGVIGEIVDISEEKKMQRDLSRSMQALEVLVKDARDASKTDPGTQLYNRSVLAEDIPNLIRDAETANMPVSVLLIDLDYFKHVNDTFGHQCGDMVLKKFAAILTGCFRSGDVAVRYGGDEFLLVLPGAPLDRARRGAERLRGAVLTELLLPDGQPMTISVGVAQKRKDEDILAFITRADEALYISKRQGRNRVSITE